MKHLVQQKKKNEKKSEQKNERLPIISRPPQCGSGLEKSWDFGIRNVGSKINFDNYDLYRCLKMFAVDIRWRVHY